MRAFDPIADKVLSQDQKDVFPLVEAFLSTHMLAGGTAIALRFGHRKSIDFDLFRFGEQGTGKELFHRIEKTGFSLDERSFFPYLSEEEEGEVEFFVQGVKIQLIDFSRSPFSFKPSIEIGQFVCGGIVPVASDIDMAAMKVYAMMYRSKWKDAVDLYWILHHTDIAFADVIARARSVFDVLYKQEATLERILADDWDHSESVEYVTTDAPTDSSITSFLQNEVKRYICMDEDSWSSQE